MEITRVLGDETAISVGLAQVIDEGAFEIKEDRPEQLLINMRTMCRNFFEAFPRDTPPTVARSIDLLVEEVAVFSSLISVYGVEPIFYFNDHSDIYRMFPNALEYVPGGEYKKLYLSYEKAAIKILKEQAVRGNLKIKSFECKVLLPSSQKRCWILTHQPSDLLFRDNFLDLKLLESHTGKVKEPFEWISKLTNNDKYHRWPYNEFTIQLLGDRSNEFKGHSIKLKNEVFKISQMKRWTVFTTMAKIRENLKLIQDPELQKTAMSLLKFNLR